MKMIPLLSNKMKTLYALVDDEDYLRIAGHEWWQLHGDGLIYAVRGYGVLMHREVTRAKAGTIYDHINRNGIDNRKANLRRCSPSQNGANRKKKEGKRLPFGVHGGNGRGFRAEITILGQKLKYKQAKNSVEAALFYDWMARIVHGDFAHQNYAKKRSYTIV